MGIYDIGIFEGRSDSAQDILDFIREELGAVKDAIESPAIIEFLNVAPSKPRQGMLYGADGTNWDPGAGQGVYCYYNTTWTKLG